MRPEFQQWLQQCPTISLAPERDALARCRRVEKFEGDLDQHFAIDRMATLLARLKYSREDERSGLAPRHSITFSEGANIKEGTDSLAAATRLYLRFRDESSSQTSLRQSASANHMKPIAVSIRKTNPERERINGASPQIVDGDDILLRATAALSIDLSRLVARSAIWVDLSVFLARQRQHSHAAWFPDCRRGRKGEPRRGLIDGVRFDDNTIANLAIKRAVFGSREGCTRLHACHVWPETCYDVRYHTALANLVLLPAPLAGLSDHHEGVAACLRYRSYELFGWHPEEVSPPSKPAGYPEASEWTPFPQP
jgi:hypothetical protein